MSPKSQKRFSTEEELKEFGRKWGARLRAGDCLFLDGELGAGKTTFAASIIEGLSPKTQFLGSPTFPIVHEYEIGNENELLHIDVYRLESEVEFNGAGIDEAFFNSSKILIIEWMSKFPDIFKIWANVSNRRITRVELKIASDLSRELLIK